MTLAGAVFGFAVHSDLPFRFLRDDAGSTARLDVVAADVPRPADEPVIGWERGDGIPFTAWLHAAAAPDAGWTLWFDGGDGFAVDPSRPCITVPPAEEPVRREERALGLPALLCFVARGDVPLHAAAVEVDGGAVLVAGPTRAGKTTLAAAFLDAGHRVLAEDLCCLRVAPEGAVLFPGPASLRVRRDTWQQVRPAAADVVGEDDERVHLALGPAARGDGAPVPVRAIVLLRGGDDDEVRLRRRSPADAVRDLWVLSFNLPDDGDRARCFRSLADLATTVPVYDVVRPVRFAALDTVVTALRRALGAPV